MSEDSGSGGAVLPGARDVPTAVVRTGSSFSLVWLVPIVAILIGGWIAWRAISEQGPTVTITFKSAEGLETGQTKVRYKDLQVGMVAGIELAEDLSHVIVTAELKPNAERYLTENTRFWVVRPQISAGRVTGLGTLFSGSYIAIDPVREGEPRLEFTGLETQPVMTASEPGRIFTLRSSQLGSLDVGAPVYYRQIQVGEVASYEMDASGDFVTSQVFVRAPHDQRVRANTRFWNASGLDVTLDAEGVRVEMASFVSMLIGGIAFDLLGGDDPGGPVPPDKVFTLFDSQRASEQPVYAVKERYLLHFANSVQGLAPGSPVVFRGIRIGRVVDLHLQFDWENYGVVVPVVIEIEPERIERGDDEGRTDPGRIARLVEKGLRVQLGRRNLLTGGLQIEFEVHPDAEPRSILAGGVYPELPTIPAPFDEITSSVSGVIAKIDRMPLDQIGADLQAALVELRLTLAETRKMAAAVNADVMPALANTMERLDGTIGSLEGMLRADAPLPLELRRSHEDVGEAARSVRVLAEYLEQHPEALIRGKK
jgi:paraquat-inducible protein B